MAQKELVPQRDAAKYLLQESRMILPGLQALFGFQLIVVFESNFYDYLSYPEQILHVVAMGLVAVAIILVVAPAAFHRYQGEREVSRTFLSAVSILLSSGMIPLALALAIELYLVMSVVIANMVLSIVSALALLFLSALLWFFIPRNHFKEN